MNFKLLPTALLITLASGSAFAKTELETLRSRCAEQERQIQHLEQENTKLRSGGESTTPAEAKPEKAPPATAKPESVTPISAKVEPAATIPASNSSYIVKPGDSLEKIARKVRTSHQKLAKLNGLKLNAIIHPGQKLKTPGVEAPAKLQPAATATATAASTAPAKSPVETPAPVASKEKKIHAVTIHGEMTYGEFAAKHGTDAERLNALNGLDLTTATVLAKGSELYVPAKP